MPTPNHILMKEVEEQKILDAAEYHMWVFDALQDIAEAKTEGTREVCWFGTRLGWAMIKDWED